MRAAAALWALLAASAACPSLAKSTFRGAIPNGDRVPCPGGVDGCLNTICEGVGHNTCTGGTLPLNPFGAAFKAAGFVWSDVCDLDSDGDGQTNGEELGDPCCRWSSGAYWDALASYEVSHPGFASSTSLSAASRDDCVVGGAPPAQVKEAVFADGETGETLEFTLSPAVDILADKKDSYVHFYVNIPVDDVYHVVGFETIVDNAEHLHHFVLYACPEPFTTTDSEGTWSYQGDSPPMLEDCEDTIWGWAPGSVVTVTPKEAGFRCGKGTGCQALYLDVHYSNQQLAAGKTDASGFKLHYTKDLRANDMGVLWTGSVTQNIKIPPGKAAYYDMQVCVVKGPPGVTFKGTDFSVHAHQIGTQVVSEHYDAQGQLVGGMGEDRAFRFDNQMLRPLPKDTTFKAGEYIATACVFDSRGQDKTVYGGDGSYDEMCINFIQYWPRREDVWCAPYSQQMGELADGVLGNLRDLSESEGDDVDWRKDFEAEEEEEEEEDCLDPCYAALFSHPKFGAFEKDNKVGCHVIVETVEGGCTSECDRNDPKALWLSYGVCRCNDKSDDDCGDGGGWRDHITRDEEGLYAAADDMFGEEGLDSSSAARAGAAVAAAAAAAALRVL